VATVPADCVDVTRSSVTAEIVRVGGYYALQRYSRSLNLVPIESAYMPLPISSELYSFTSYSHRFQLLIKLWFLTGGTSLFILRSSEDIVTAFLNFVC